jgi:hypothetical protein
MYSTVQYSICSSFIFVFPNTLKVRYRALVPVTTSQIPWDQRKVEIPVNRGRSTAQDLLGVVATCSIVHSGYLSVRLIIVSRSGYNRTQVRSHHGSRLTM